MKKPQQDTLELPLEAPEGVLEALCALLPDYVVRGRRNGISWHMVPSLAQKELYDALAKGFLIDKSNGDGPLEEWDGWLVIYDEAGEMFLETDPARRPKVGHG
jgi:hypothetical protein